MPFEGVTTTKTASEERKAQLIIESEYKKPVDSKKGENEKFRTDDEKQEIEILNVLGKQKSEINQKAVVKKADIFARIGVTEQEFERLEPVARQRFI